MDFITNEKSTTGPSLVQAARKQKEETLNQFNIYKFFKLIYRQNGEEKK